jgi:light-regulated signal transduction histidine kinase (bacteriophytochrome)
MKDATLEDFKLTDAVKKAMENLATTLLESEAQIMIGRLPQVHGDFGRTIQLFQNLIANAIKYRSQSQPPIVHINAKKCPGGWMIEVADNGMGIEKQFHHRIFEMFRRLHGQEIPGSGVGLGICKKIVEHLGGKIWVESEVGKGSRFFFTIPHEVPEKGNI